MAYAKRTKVSPEQTKAELEQLVLAHGATGYMTGHRGKIALVGFEMRDRQIQFLLPMPEADEPEFARKAVNATTSKPRTEPERIAAWQQACAQRWRQALLVVKAKLEAVEVGIVAFEEEFLAHIVLPGGQTVGQAMIPRIASAYETGSTPPLLGHFGGSE